MTEAKVALSDRRVFEEEVLYCAAATSGNRRLALTHQNISSLRIALRLRVLHTHAYALCLGDWPPPLIRTVQLQEIVRGWRQFDSCY
jgi:hypothetical protein